MLLMSRKANPFEVLALHEIRDGARKFVAEEFPAAEVNVHISKIDGQLGVAATIGNTQPHSQDDVMYCLADLGVSQVMIVDPNAA